MTAGLCCLLFAPVTAGSRLTDLLRQETSTLATLERLTGQVLRTEQDLADASQKLEQIRFQIQESGRRSEALKKRSSERRNMVRCRIKQLYKASRGGFARLVLDTRDGQDLFFKLSVTTRVLRRDVEEIKLYQKELAHEEGERRALQQKLVLQADLQQRLRSVHGELDRARRELQGTRAWIRASRRRFIELCDELSETQRLLLARIAVLSYRIHRRGGFPAHRGRLPPPLFAPVAARFGSAVAGRDRLQILRHGLTFRPHRGAQVFAVAKGQVRLAGPLAGYGQLVLVEHSDGYFTTYAFLAALKVREGEKVRQGTVLGTAGLDPLLGGPALYFELRHREQPLDPLDWMWKRS